MSEPYWEPFGGPQGPAGPAYPSCMAYAYGVAMPAGGALQDLNINGTRWNDWSPGFVVGQPKIVIPSTGRYRATVTAYFSGQSGGVGTSQLYLVFANAAGVDAESIYTGMAALNIGSTIVHTYPFGDLGSVRMKAASGAGGAGGSIYAFMMVEKLS